MRLQWLGLAFVLVSCGGGGGSACCTEDVHIVSFTAQKQEVVRGEQVRLTWTVAGGNACRLSRTFDGELSDLDIPVQCSGSHNETPVVPPDSAFADYMLTVEGSGGSTDVESVRVNFTVPKYGTRILSFSAHPLQVGPDEEITLSWEAVLPGTFEGVDSCSLSRRAEFQDAKDAVTMSTSCKGSLTDVPTAPDGSTYVRYQLNILKDVIDTGGDPADAFLYNTVTVELLDERFSGAIDWKHQFGTTVNELATAVALDEADNVFVAGTTRGDLAGANAGETDVFVRALEADGTVMWTEQFGGNGYDTAVALATDKSGNVFVLGRSAPSDPTIAINAYLRKLTPSGSLVWEKHPTPDGADGNYTHPIGIAVSDSGTIFIVGAVYTTGYLSALDTNGNALWSRYFCPDGWVTSCGEGCTSSSFASSVAVLGGEAYVTGTTRDSLFDYGLGSEPDSTDAFLARVQGDGSLAWGIQFGSSGYDYGASVAVSDIGIVAVAGATDGSIDREKPAFGSDVFVFLRNSEDGSYIWSEQYGETTEVGNSAWATSIGIDGAGNVIVASMDSREMRVDKFYATGELVWTRLLGRPDEPGPSDRLLSAIALDSVGGVLAVGNNSNDDFGIYRGENDAYIARLKP